MTEVESIYFDFVRVSAALVVLIGHVVLLMPGAFPVSDHGHDAVVAFFVLSGYVIAFVADTKEKTARDYFVSRAARLYSVALPAIILTLACDFMGLRAAGHAIYQPYSGDWPLVRVGAALSFTSELWFMSIQPFSDGPYWSLCYEAWYYVIFAAAMYLTGRRRVVGITILCLLVGPKILSMFPIWLLGVALYRYRRDVGPWLGAFLIISSLVGLIAFIESPIPNVIAKFMNGLLGSTTYRLMEYAHNFPTDYITGSLFAIGFVGVRGFAGRIKIPLGVAVAIRWAAGSTFSLYLFHHPLILLFTSISNPMINFLTAILITLLTIIVAIALSYVTERRKRAWRAMATFFLSYVPLTDYTRVTTVTDSARLR